MNTSLVVVNSFDAQKESIEEILEDHRVYAEMLEVDRLNKDEREEYLVCFDELYQSRKLPLIFIDDTLVASNSNELLKHFQ